MEDSGNKTREQLLKEIEKLNNKIEKHDIIKVRQKKAEEEIHEQTETINSIVNTTNDWIWTINLEGIHTYSNPAVENILGYSIEEIVGNPSFDLMHEVDRKIVETKIPYWISEKIGWQNLVVRWRHKDGSWRYLEGSAVPIIDLKGEIKGFRGVDRDITERKQAEEELFQAKKFIDTALDAQLDTFFLFEPSSGKAIHWNRAFREVSGYTDEEIASMHAPDSYYSQEDLEREGPAIQKIIDGEEEVIEMDLICKDGSKVPMEYRASMIKDDKNESRYMVSIGRDITIQKKALEEMKNLAAIINYSSELVNLSTTDGRMTFLNESGCKMLGIEPHEVENVNIMNVIPDNLKTKVEKELLPALMRGETWEGDLQYRNLKTGKLTDVYAMTFSIKDPDTGELQYLANVSRDITDRKQMNEILKNSEERLRIIFESAPDAIYLNDLKGKFLDGNKSAEDILGYKKEELIGKSFLKLNLLSANQIPKAIKSMAKSVQGKKTGPDEYILARKDGSSIPVEISSYPIKLKNKTAILGIARDVTKRKKTEQALQESEKKYRLMFENMINGLAYHKIVTDNNGKPIDYNFIEINQGFENITGLKRKDIIGKNVTEVLPGIEKDSTDWIGIYGKVALEGKHIQFQSFSESINKWYSIFAYSTQKGYFVTIIEDITEKNRAEEILHQYERIVSSSSDMMALLDKKYKYLAVNSAYLEGFKLSREKLIGNSVANLFGKEFFKTVIKPHADLCLSGIDVNYQTWFELPDFGKCYLDINYFPYIDEENKVSGFVVNSRNITERKKSEELIQRFSRILEDSLNEIFLFDSDTFKFSQVNLSAQRNLGYTMEELKELTPLDIKPEYTSESFAKLIAPLLKKEKEKIVFETVHQRKDQSLYNVEVHMQLIQFENESMFASIIMDISERKQAEERIKKALIKAEESDRLKSSFLANMSHEIRTPMNAIIGFSNLLSTVETEEQLNEFAKIIINNGEHLLNIINDIIDISQIEAGIIKIENKECNINIMLDNILDIYKIKDKIKNKKIELIISKDLPDNKANILIDSTRLQQILINLVENAYKFTEKGKIEWGYTLKKEKNNSELLEFFVKDTGGGIQKNRQEMIFDRFMQEDNSTTRLIEGTGLGLTIAKAIIKLLGGKIWVESEPRQGSIFYFTIPYRRCNVTNIVSKSSVREIINWNDKTILIAEDMDESYYLMENFLEDTNATIIRAKNGFEAIEKCKKENKIDLVLMDIRMPDKNGLEATKEIKKFRPDLPILAQTAYAIRGDKEKAFKAGCDDYLSKPISPDLLIEKMNFWLAKKKQLKK
ncbi:PAS domain S-box protein [Bacteroidota bacterium]